MNTEGHGGSNEATDVFLLGVAAPDEHQPDEQAGECGRGEMEQAKKQLMVLCIP